MFYFTFLSNEYCYIVRHFVHVYVLVIAVDKQYMTKRTDRYTMKSPRVKIKVKCVNMPSDRRLPAGNSIDVY